MRVVVVTMDNHLAAAAERAQASLDHDLPGVRLCYHAASQWADDPDSLAACRADIDRGDIIVTSMLFLEDHFQPILANLKARREQCDAMVSCISAGEVVRLTRLGKFSMDGEARGAMALLKRLKPKKTERKSAGANQVAMLRRLPKILRFIPGTAQDVRAYFLTMQYWLSGSDENLGNMVRFLVDRYAGGANADLRGRVQVRMPTDHPEVGVYHPRMPGRIAETAEHLPAPPHVLGVPKAAGGTVGLLVLRSYLLSGDTGHYDGVIAAFEARGIRVIPAFAGGLDNRPAVERYFLRDGRPIVDAVVSLTGFSLVGGPAYNDSTAAEEVLGRLDVPYVAAHALEFQSLDQWGGNGRGLLPVESTIMVAIPELDGATAPTVFGGRFARASGACHGCYRHCRFDGTAASNDMHVCPERAETLVARIARMIDLRRADRAARKVAVVLFNFPPNSGATGSAAYLAVFESLYNVLSAMAREGYAVEVPDSVDALRDAILGGNSDRFGTDANVLARIPADDHVRGERWLSDIEGVWGPAPGRQLSNGREIFVMGAQFGNVVVGVQPGFGYEGDPMRLLFEQGFAPTHAFSAFYRYLRDGFGAQAVLHFGTHGALEFMPGKQAGLSGDCWPDRLIGDLPNLYLYAANNPSEGSIAKRRAAATLLSYLTPPVGHAGLYRGLLDLKASLDRWRALPPEDAVERARLLPMIQAQAAELDLVAAEPDWAVDGADHQVVALADQVLELEYTLIPQGLHVVGRPPGPEERIDTLTSMAEGMLGLRPDRAVATALVAGKTAEQAARAGGLPSDAATLAALSRLAETDGHMARDTEIPAILHALDGGFVRPAPGGDLLRTTEILPTGRNLHGFDPFRLPSAFAVKDGAAQAQRLLERHMADGNPLPESIAIVLWGTDNLKSEGGPIGQALALIGARPRFDGYGRLSGAELIPLAELGRPRIDVLMTLSGIFRDLLPMQIRLLAEAAHLAALADEPEAMNFVRKHALAHVAAHGGSLEDAALRVFSNADGAYGSNVNQLIDSGAWQDEDELADTYAKRKCFAYGRDGRPAARPELLTSVLAGVDLAYQNLESVELGVTTVDHYFDTLGGIGRAAKKARGDGRSTAVYIGDQTRGTGKVRSLDEQVALEARTRTLNPKWYEGMLEHGYEGVRQIEAQITNTMGWSATTGAVAPWVYQRLTETFVLDEQLRNRMAALNPKASARLANRLLEASDRRYWTPDDETLEALRDASEDLEDRLEGIIAGDMPADAVPANTHTTTTHTATTHTATQATPQPAKAPARAAEPTRATVAA